MSKKVSILIPLFNAEEWIIDTIQSVLDQTHPNIEIIVVDDGSTDNSYILVENINSSKIKLVKNKNKGACAARNYAFELCSGDFIQYLDADDLIAPDKIENQLKIFEIYGDDIIVFGKWARFYSNLDGIKYDVSNINKDYDNPINCLVNCWNGIGMIPVNSWLTPRIAIKMAGTWNENLYHNQDGEFFSRVLLNVKYLKYCNDAKAYYRSGLSNSISHGSKTEKQARSQLLSYQLYVNNVGKYLNEQNVKIALANNFINFIYRFYNLYPDLIKNAEQEFNLLNVGKMWPNGGANFKIISKCIGFKNALKFRKLLKS